MLLLEPPLTCDEWAEARFREPGFTTLFSTYCHAYEHAVLSLPYSRLARIMAHLVRGLESTAITAKSIHRMVERELEEENYELSGKVVRLIVLNSLVESLSEHGIRIPSKTSRMLRFCQEVIPPMLLLAIDDHFGLLSLTE